MRIIISHNRDSPMALRVVFWVEGLDGVSWGGLMAVETSFIDLGRNGITNVLNKEDADVI